MESNFGCSKKYELEALSFVHEHKVLTDIEFIHVLYEALLDRKGDSAGIAHHLDRLKNRTADRSQVVMDFLNSGEYQKRLGIQQNEKTRYSDPLTLEERENLYREMVLRQDFYDASYSDESWQEKDDTHIAKAYYIDRYFDAQKILDVGCSFGRLVQALREKGRDAWGTDYSRYFVDHAHPDVREFIQTIKVEELQEFVSDRFDLLLCMEVLEHLPLSVINKALTDFSSICKDTLLITVPSHGPNTQGRYGFPLHHVEAWVASARENRTFQVIPVERDTGKPHCGHITLATYRWWTDKFLQYGWVRDYSLEAAITEDPAGRVKEMGWCLYVLHRAEASAVTAEENVHQLAKGFVHRESFTGRPVYWTAPEAEWVLKPKSEACGECIVELVGPYPQAVYSMKVVVTIEQLSSDADHLHRKKVIKQEMELIPGSVTEMHIHLPKTAWNTDQILLFNLKSSRPWQKCAMLNSFVWGDHEYGSDFMGAGFIRACIV